MFVDLLEYYKLYLIARRIYVIQSHVHMSDMVMMINEY